MTILSLGLALTAGCGSSNAAGGGTDGGDGDASSPSPGAGSGPGADSGTGNGHGNGGGAPDSGSGPGPSDASGSSGGSPSCTTITQPGQSIVDASGNTWTLVGPSTNLVVDVNGKAAGVSADVTRLVYVKGVISQENVWGGWWSWGAGTWNAESDPTGSCGTDGGASCTPKCSGKPCGSDGCGGSCGSCSAGTACNASGQCTTGATPPAPAAAVGYDMRTYGPDVTLGVNWATVAAANAVQNADGSVTVAGPWHYNDLVDTNGIMSFGGGGYFEATLSWANPNAGWSALQNIGWPAWWANTIEGRSVPFPNTRGIEVDFLEAMATDDASWSSGMWDWYTGGPQSGGAVVDMPSGMTGHESHQYGFLWVPATATTKGRGEYYLDRVHVPAKDLTWDLYDPSSSPPYTQGTTMFACLDVQHIYLMFGTGAPNPMTVTSVEVWQVNDASNIHH